MGRYHSGHRVRLLLGDHPMGAILTCRFHLFSRVYFYRLSVKLAEEILSESSQLPIDDAGSIRLFDTRSSRISRDQQINDLHDAEESHQFMIEDAEEQMESEQRKSQEDNDDDDMSWSRASFEEDERPSPLMKNTSARRSHVTFYENTEQEEAGSSVLLSNPLAEEQDILDVNVPRANLGAKAGIILVDLPSYLYYIVF